MGPGCFQLRARTVSVINFFSVLCGLMETRETDLIDHIATSKQESSEAGG